MNEVEFPRDARCAGVDPELFFPMPADHAGEAAAVAFCRGCPVREDCLEFALSVGAFDGVFGGLTGDERAALHRARRVVRARSG